MVDLLCVSCEVINSMQIRRNLVQPERINPGEDFRSDGLHMSLIEIKLNELY